MDSEFDARDVWIKIIFESAPVILGFADETGADGFGENAGAAVSVARALADIRKK